MQKIILVVAALFLSACTPGSPVVAILSGGVSNPVTPRIAFQLQAGIDEIAVGTGAYARLPRCSHSAPPCSSQAIVSQMRKYVNKAEDAAHKLDQWALGNTSLDGPALYRAAKIAIGIARDYGQSNGVI